jgi:hypothetical protein
VVRDYYRIIMWVLNTNYNDLIAHIVNLMPCYLSGVEQSCIFFLPSARARVSEKRRHIF